MLAFDWFLLEVVPIKYKIIKIRSYPQIYILENLHYLLVMCKNYLALVSVTSLSKTLQLTLLTLGYFRALGFFFNPSFNEQAKLSSDFY